MAPPFLSMTALLFDLNGVLVDDEEQHYEALRAVLATEQIELAREDYYATFVGLDDRLCIVEAFRRANRTLVAEHIIKLVENKAEAYRGLVEGSLRLVPGAADFVAQAAATFRLAVVSGSPRREIHAALERTGLQRHFGVIVASEDVRRGKPDPEGLLQAHAALTGDRPGPREQCIVIEDSLPGLHAAGAAGMVCAMLTTSHNANTLRRAGADLIWESFVGHRPEELLPLIEGRR
ncbi:MAG: HAD family hydrolase [Gemmatimonadales bacterium]